MLDLLKRFDFWRRQRRWRGERSRMFAEADVLVVSHTKSGRTWLRVMLSRVYHLRHGLPERELIRFDNFHRLDRTVPKVHFTRDTRFPPERDDPGAIRIDPRQKVIFLVRDPRDVAVSFYFHVAKRASDAELARKGIAPEARAMDPFAFAAHPRLGVPRVIGFYNRWAEEARALPRAMRVRYEDLRADPARELGRVMRFVGEPATAAEIEEAVAFASFERLQEKERQGFFASGRLGATDASDPMSYKVREGRIGGYRDRFTPEQVAALDALVERELAADYGYGGRRHDG